MGLPALVRTPGVKPRNSSAQLTPLGELSAQRPTERALKSTLLRFYAQPELHWRRP